jgi:hypothetical protein
MKKLTIQLRRIKLYLIVGGIFLYILLTIPIYSALVFEYENKGKLLAYLPINSDDKFDILYTHSIHLSPVLESYSVRENKIVQNRLEYQDFAIGMPADAEGNEQFIQEDGKYIISNMNRVFDTIDLRVGQVISNHTIIHAEKKIPFSTFVKKGTWIRIKVRHISIWEILKGGNIDEHQR